MSCECKKKFDLENAVALKYGMQLENFKSEAKIRLGKICKETCFVCLNTIKNSNINNPSNIQHKNGNFLLDINQKPEKENVIEYNKLPHWKYGNDKVKLSSSSIASQFCLFFL